jgi:hypothetical protein
VIPKNSFWGVHWRKKMLSSSCNQRSPE